MAVPKGGRGMIDLLVFSTGLWAALIGALIVLEKLVGALQAEARRAKMRARTRRSLRERAKQNKAIQRRAI